MLTELVKFSVQTQACLEKDCLSFSILQTWKGGRYVVEYQIEQQSTSILVSKTYTSTTNFNVQLSVTYAGTGGNDSLCGVK